MRLLSLSATFCTKTAKARTALNSLSVLPELLIICAKAKGGGSKKRLRVFYKTLRKIKISLVLLAHSFYFAKKIIVFTNSMQVDNDKLLWLLFRKIIESPAEFRPPPQPKKGLIMSFI